MEINIKTLNDKALAQITYKCMCKVLRKEKMYCQFRCFVGGATSVYRSFPSFERYEKIAIKTSNQNPFFRARTLNEFYCELTNALGNSTKINKNNNNNTALVQERIMQFINLILHHSVELFINNFLSLETIGEEVFNTTCRQIYGNDFVDETAKVDSSPLANFRDMYEKYEKIIRSLPPEFRNTDTIRRLFEKNNEVSSYITNDMPLSAYSVANGNWDSSYYFTLPNF